MRKKAWLLAVVMAVGTGCVFIVGSADGANARTYRCLSSTTADGGTALTVHNPTGDGVSGRRITRDVAGAVQNDVAFTVPAHGTSNYSFAMPTVIMEFKTSGKLFIDGDAKFNFGASPDLIRQIRCS
jgi:hypothetical protein